VKSPRPISTSLALVLALALGATACGASDSGAEPTSTSTAQAGDGSTTTTDDGSTGVSAASASASSAGISDLRGVRYCEVLLLTKDAGGYQADVWNTMGMSDCPPDQWKALDAKTIASERGAILALLNGPRFWTLDSISTDLRKGAPETTFGDVAMFRAASVDLGDTLPTQTPYTERPVARDTVFGFDAGSEVYELVAPDGTTYIMQSWSQIIDPGLTEQDLAGLGDRLDLPEGWTFEVRTLDDDLDVVSTDGVATVVQDELQNTYQRIDAS
jgi:hypothetical protein